MAQPTSTSPASSTSALLAVGTRLGGVRIERLLTSGAMGALYLAFDEADGAPLAVKAVVLGQPGDPALAGAQGRFQHETLSAIRLRHPGIVLTHGAVLQGGMGFVAMELLTGTNLSRYTRPSRLLPEPLALSIAARVAEALAFAHRAGVVHRDVKPANVMFDPATDSVKLTDFGLARAVDAEATRSGVLLGSPAYMAPEMLAGARADAAGDLYSLGVLLFELLVGRLPHQGQSMGELLRQVANEPAPDLQGLRPDLPVNLAQLVASLLAKAAAGRPRDGDAVALQLRLLGQALSKPPDGVGVKSR